MGRTGIISRCNFFEYKAIDRAQVYEYEVPSAQETAIAPSSYYAIVPQPPPPVKWQKYPKHVHNLNLGYYADPAVEKEKAIAAFKEWINEKGYNS